MTYKLSPERNLQVFWVCTQEEIRNIRVENSKRLVKCKILFRNVSFVRNRRIDYIRLRYWWVLLSERRLGQKVRGGERRSLSRIESSSRAWRDGYNRGTRADRTTSPCQSIGLQ